MADWSTVASLATAGGTLVLAVATFASVRSSNRTARLAEQSMMSRMRPLLVPSRLEDPPEKVSFMGDHWVRVPGGHGTAEVVDGMIFLTMALRNVGAGIAVLDRWNFHFDPIESTLDHGDPATFRRLTRDLFIAPSDRGFWQGAIRDHDDADFERVRALIEARESIRLQLLYNDGEGGQRMVSLFSLVPIPSGDGWLTVAGRHWNLDRADPR